MKLIISFILAIIALNFSTYFVMWIAEQEFDVVGWFALFAPATDFSYRIDYIVQLLIWAMLVSLTVCVWTSFYALIDDFVTSNKRSK